MSKVDDDEEEDDVNGETDVSWMYEGPQAEFNCNVVVESSPLETVLPVVVTLRMMWMSVMPELQSEMHLALAKGA
ncbi:hypothetical protein BGX30_001444 [Mortierella sp. GBA39]|nr:hypothetical protein BGX30_001444 [Mortierella sp. GBA39]